MESREHPKVTRYLQRSVTVDLQDRMVFIGGPRQVGKTTLALDFLNPPSTSSPGYLSWDDAQARKIILRGELPLDAPQLVLDEIHKFARWRQLVKGWFDIHGKERRILVTGSARLDYYRKGGDSLQGRYHYYRLHPFSLPELENNRELNNNSYELESPIGLSDHFLDQPLDQLLDQLLGFGGFPEPLLRGDKRFWRRWQRERRQRVVYGDLRDLENVREVSLLDLLVEELPERVGSPLSLSKLADVLQVAHATVARWLEILERLYVCFRIAPYGSPKIRAVKKEQKLYLWDWSLVEKKGPRFENMVASHLLKYCHFVEDTEGRNMDLRYLRDTDGREVDFVVLRDGTPQFAVEVKQTESNPDSSLYYFRDRTPIPLFYQVHLKCGQRGGFEKNGIRVLPFARFCKEAGLV